MPHITSTGPCCTDIRRVDPEYAGVPDQGRDVVIRDQRQHVVGLRALGVEVEQDE